MNWLQYLSWAVHNMVFPLATPTIANNPPGKPTPSAAAIFDDFNGAVGSTPNPALWAVPTFPANNQVPGLAQPSAANVSIDGNSNLALTATPNSGTWTAGWLSSAGLQAFGYGTFSASIKMPGGAGLTPAFWLMGEDYSSEPPTNWPACGEIDIIEYLTGAAPHSYSCTLHGPVYTGPLNPTNSQVQLNGQFGFDPSQGFHTYWCKHLPGSVTFGIDQTTINTLTQANIQNGAIWAYDTPFSVLFDIGVGMNDVLIPPNAETADNATMLVDWFLWEPAN